MKKLKDRSVRIVIEITGLGRIQAQELLIKARGRVKAAIVMHFQKTDFAGAQKLLKQNNDLCEKS